MALETWNVITTWMKNQETEEVRRVTNIIAGSFKYKKGTYN